MWTLIRFLHLSAAAIWIGGQALLLVAAPAIRAQAADATPVLSALGKRFGLLSVPALLLLLATGGAQSAHLRLDHTWQVQTKMGVLGIIILLTVVHSVIGIRISRGQEAEGSPLRRYGRWISAINFTLGLVALWAAASLATNY
jgi:uncharacterized membrane protein